MTLLLFFNAKGYMHSTRAAIALQLKKPNRAMQILDPAIREQVQQIIHKLLGGT